MGAAIMWVWDNGAALLNALTLTIAAASAIAALTPTPEDDAAVAKLRRIVDLLGMNWGHAKNRTK